jgi:hypothetical protein
MAGFQVTTEVAEVGARRDVFLMNAAHKST